MSASGKCGIGDALRHTQTCRCGECRFITIESTFGVKPLTGEVAKLVDLLGKGRVLENYVLAGLRSTLLGETAAGGKLQLFEMLRVQEADIVPHDHRYDFQCFVLDGEVEHLCYELERVYHPPQAAWAVCEYDPDIHSVNDETPRAYTRGTVVKKTHGAGSWYGLKHDQFHAVRFSAGARVLFIEGPEVQPFSHVLLPYQDGRVCNTFVWRTWMMRPKS